MNRAGRFTVLCTSILAAVSVFQPTKVIAEKNYKDYDIKPFTLQDKDLEKIQIEKTGIYIHVPYSWTIDDYDYYYPGKEDESVSFYSFESSDQKTYSPEQDIDDVVDYLLNEEPELIESTLSAKSTEYLKVGDQHIAKTSYNVTVTDEGEKVSWKEINYIVPVNKKYIVVINVVLDTGKKQSYAKEEEALILTIEDGSKKLFADYIKTQSSQSTAAKTAAIGSVNKSTGSTAATVSTPAPATKSTVVVQSYVLNKNTKKFHFPGCSSVSRMKASNRWDVEMSRDEVISMGYVPCQRCNP